MPVFCFSPPRVGAAVSLALLSTSLAARTLTVISGP